MNPRSVRLVLASLAVAFATLVCSSGYITPQSLQATQGVQQEMTATASAYVPSATPTELPTLTPTPRVQVTPTPQESPSPAPPFIYTAQSGDTVEVLAVRFGVDISHIASPQNISTGLITPGQIFTIPNITGLTTPNEKLIPDSEVIFSPSAIGFEAAAFANPFGGYVASYREYLPSAWYSGAGVVERVAVENSLNPRLLLSVLQFQSNWVLGEPVNTSATEYPLGYRLPQSHGLYQQLTWAAKQLSTGYYGWREGRLTELTFRDGIRMRISPELNAGTVAIQYLFAQLYDYEDWAEIMDRTTGFAFTHSSMFPDPWVRAAQTEPLFPPALAQPALSLPFLDRQVWYFTSGPHGAWEREGSWAALDFAPSSSLPGCVPSTHWVTAAAPGLVVRTSPGVIVVDMDGDGNEQTGWVVLYLHVTGDSTPAVGTWLDRGDRLGHPSCEGGTATATHVHIARKYNGEWIGGGGALPFVLSGWTVQYGSDAYLGNMVRNGRTVVACTCSGRDSLITISSDDPY
ncbi:MAG TPA: LysM peptidoglycan-binding domain-containing protein [Anaerolineales bacterium]|nr:LysM peptidoglycan-binding domain-containing protein [Anaerolineales bacterium]HRQ91817.1 LysM peptidoglycan-binding domain-containing protein [Anaerolineales bacterium]